MTTTTTDDTGRTVKEYPRTTLRGPFLAWYSGKMMESGGYPKFHVDRRCGGLERTKREHLVSERFADAWELGESEFGRPCRACTLERVMYTVLRPKAEGNIGTALVFTTFTSQPCPTSPDQNLYRYKWKVSTESGQDRLRRIAERFKLPTANSSPGPMAWGFLPERGASILATNLRTEIRADVTELPESAVLECMWVLMDDNPPQLRDHLSDGTDPWDLARLLIG